MGRAVRACTSRQLDETMVLFHMSTDWFDSMKPMPPMSAARLNTSWQPFVALPHHHDNHHHSS